MKTILMSIVLALLSGCANLDKLQTELKTADNCEKGFDYYTYKAFEDVDFKENSPNGEKYRMEMLELLLKDNGYDAGHYEILSRIPVLKNKALLGDMYDVYYTIKVPKK